MRCRFRAPPSQRLDAYFPFARVGRPISLSLESAVVAAQAASSKTLEPTSILDVGDLIGITDHFVISAGRNDRQVRAIVEEVQKQLRDNFNLRVRQVEGQGDNKWVLLDYGDFVVHVFDNESRDMYQLERLWADAKRIPFVLEFASEGATS